MPIEEIDLHNNDSRDDAGIPGNAKEGMVFFEIFLFVSSCFQLLVR